MLPIEDKENSVFFWLEKKTVQKNKNKKNINFVIELKEEIAPKGQWKKKENRDQGQINSKSKQTF